MDECNIVFQHVINVDVKVKCFYCEIANGEFEYFVTEATDKGRAFLLLPVHGTESGDFFNNQILWVQERLLNMGMATGTTNALKIVRMVDVK